DRAQAAEILAEGDGLQHGGGGTSRSEEGRATSESSSPSPRRDPSNQRPGGRRSKTIHRPLAQRASDTRHVAFGRHVARRAKREKTSATPHVQRDAPRERAPSGARRALRGQRQ